MKPLKIVVLFSKGGLGDVGRHAVRAALDRTDPKIDQITVLSQHIETLNEENWNCGCTTPHKFTEDEKKRLTIVQIDSWDEKVLSKHFEGALAVVSCLGNRQMNLNDRVGGEGSRVVVKAMNEHKIERAVIMSSVGIQNDWPPLEFHWAGKVMSFFFSQRMFSRMLPDYKDLSDAEEAFLTSKDIDYLMTRPVGLGEEVVPQNKWLVQKEKYKDKSLYFNMAKLDCARFMIEEALNPTQHKTGAVVGCPKPEQE